MPQLGTVQRVALALVGAVVLGIAIAILKGQSDGLRDAVGNLSGPWLLVAFWCGSLARRGPAGAVLGAVATVFALAGFCLGLALISDYGTTSAAASVHLAFRANTRYFAAGMISGPILGAFGAIARRHAADRTLLTGAVLLAEPIATIAGHQSGAFGGLIGFWSGFRTTAYLIEGAFGALVIIAALASRNRSAPSADPS